MLCLFQSAQTGHLRQIITQRALPGQSDAKSPETIKAGWNAIANRLMRIFFTPDTHLDRWLFVMARRLWLNELRRDAIRQTESFSAGEEDQHAAQIPDSETNILAREVFQKMNALPEAQRVTALLVFVEGYTYAETADLLDIPPGTVMSRISATRKTLAAQLEAATGTDA